MCFKMIFKYVHILNFFSGAIAEPLQSHFAKIAHKVANSKYFVDIYNESDSSINSLSNDI